MLALLLSACGGGGGGGNNNPPPAPAGSMQFEASSLTVDENAGTASFAITRTGGSAGAVSMTVTSSDDSATAGQDYTAINESVTFGDGDIAAKSVTVPIRDDDQPETDETLILRLSGPTGGASLGTSVEARLTIRDNDAAAPGSVQFEASSFDIGENAGTASFMITRTGGSAGAVSVTVTSSDGSATAGQDYTTVNETVIFADGSSTAQIVVVPITDDNLAEGNETLSLTLSAPTGGAVLGANDVATLTILDNDAPAPAAGSLQFEANNFDIDENAGTASLRVTRTGGSAGAVSVTVRTSNGSATAGPDYTARNTSVSFADGNTSAKTVTIPIIDDDEEEADETLSVTLSAPMGGASLGTNTTATVKILDNDPPAAPPLTVGANLKQFVFTWPSVPTATTYRLFESPDGNSAFTQVGPDHGANETQATVDIPAVHRVDWRNALYRLEACNARGHCSASAAISALDAMVQAIGYFKASNTGSRDLFGTVALSADGNTLAVGARGESSAATGIDGNQADNGAIRAGAVYVFTRTATGWSQQAYVKASNAEAEDVFGESLALSADGNTLAVAAPVEDSAARGIDGNQANGAGDSGAVYVFTRTGAVWSQQAYVKASNTEANDTFGDSLALSGDGSTLVVGASNEDSAATGVDGNQASNGASAAGAVYVFTRSGTTWAQQAYVKASNTAEFDRFGTSLAISADGDIFAAGARFEDSAAVGVNGGQADNSADNAGAVYVFTRSGTVWAQQAYVKASNSGVSDNFGHSLALSADGSTLAVSAPQEASAATGVDGDQTDNAANNAGAVYVFIRAENIWSQQAYVKASNTGAGDLFGGFKQLALSADGNMLAVGASAEDSAAVGVDGDQADNSANEAGAAYVFARAGDTWSQQAYLKASNTGAGDAFGDSVALSADGSTLAVGAGLESSAATGIGGDQGSNSADRAGAAYIY
jgi:hypothetical protein